MSPEEPEDQLGRVLRRLDAIEARLRALEAGRTFRSVSETAAVPAVPAVPPVTADVQIPAFMRVETRTPEPGVYKPEASEPAPAGLETRVGLTWLNRIGVLTVVLGIAFFFKYAIDRGLIGETARVVLGVLLGIAVLGLAEVMSRRGHRVYAQGITGAGISILYLALYSAFGFYHLLPQLAVFGLMFLTTGAAVALSLYYDSIAIAALGLIGGYGTPLVLGTADDRPWLLFGYIFVLSAGGFGVVRRKDWKELEPLLLGGASLVFFTWFANYHPPGKEAVATVSALALYALFWEFAGTPILIAAHVLTMFAIAGAWPGVHAESLWINLLLGIAGLFAAHKRNSPEFAGAAFTVFWFAAAAWQLRNSRENSLAGIAVITLALFVFLGYAVWRLSEDRGNVEPPSALLAILGLNGVIYFGLCYFILDARYHAYLGLFAVALAAAHLAIARYLWQRLVPEGSVDAQPTAVFLSIGVAVALVTLAIPIQFSQYRITMGWAIEGAFLAWIGARTGNRRSSSVALAVFVLAFLRLAFADVPKTGGSARLLTFLITGVSFWIASRWMQPDLQALVLYLCGHFVVLWGLILQTLDWAAAYADGGDVLSVSTLSVSVLLAGYGVVMVVLGVSLRSLVNRLIGLALLALVVLKLYFYDVWQLQQTFRVVAFVVLGVLLLTASFLYSRFRSVVEKLWDRGLR